MVYVSRTKHDIVRKTRTTSIKNNKLKKIMLIRHFIKIMVQTSHSHSSHHQYAMQQLLSFQENNL